jgi:hypothetical protein
VNVLHFNLAILKHNESKIAEENKQLTKHSKKQPSENKSSQGGSQLGKEMFFNSAFLIR